MNRTPAQQQQLRDLHQARRERDLDALAPSDAMVLAWRDEGLTFARIATRLGVTRARAHQRVNEARRRQELRQPQ